MNRWRQRLNTLHSDPAERAAASSRLVQNVQNVQKAAPARGFEHFEQFERRSPPTTAPSVADYPSGSPPKNRARHTLVVEHEDNDPRACADGVARLDPEKTPGDVPLAQWRRFIEDARRFFDGPFCAVAVALGWGALDLFGCNRVRPHARIDQLGLLWLLNGRRLVALTAMTGVIETENGARQTFTRKPSETGRVFAWELEPNPARSNPQQGD